jgi:hypothetical protein
MEGLTFFERIIFAFSNYERHSVDATSVALSSKPALLSVVYLVEDIKLEGRSR